jgi:hypothetical protein
VNRTAVQVAVAGLIVLALVGALTGVPPLVCSMRALAGALVLYVLVRLVGHVTVSLVAQALTASARRGQDTKDKAGGRTN